MTMKRAYAILNIKSIKEVSPGDEERIIEGIATTPTADRMGDIVDPMGAVFALPMPLLWQHDHEKPVGLVEFATPTKSGIPFKARLPILKEAGKLKDRVDEAWQSVVAGLVRAVSIGFNAKDYEVLPNGGLRFKEWEWLELSLVTIPANSEATIQTIKSIDQKTLAAIRGNGVKKTVSFKPSSGVTETNKQTTLTDKGNSEMTIKEQLEALRAKRASASARMAEIMKASADSGETLGETEGAEFDGLESEISEIDTQIKRTESMERVQASTARPVDGTTAEKATASRGNLQLRKTEEKGIVFARYARCIAKAKGNIMLAERIAEKEYADDSRVRNIVKAAVAAGSTTDPTWVGALVGEESAAFADFVEFLRPQTILGKFGTGGIPSLRRVPFRTALVGQTSGGAGYWVGEGKAKPLTKFDFNRTTLEPLKVANIAVLTQEAIKYSNPSADVLVRDSLAEALRETIDTTFILPSAAAVPGISPASITNGVTPIVSSGSDADAVRADLRALLATYIAANNAPSSGVLIMNSLTALSVGLIHNAVTGVQEFPGLGMSGGFLLGIPVIVSDYVPSDTSGSIVVMVNAQDIWLGDEGGVSIDMSTEASLQMDDAPTQSSVATVVGTTSVSMFQTNSVAIRAEREISWAKRRASAVAYLSGVNWGA